MSDKNQPDKTRFDKANRNSEVKTESLDTIAQDASEALQGKVANLDSLNTLPFTADQAGKKDSNPSVAAAKQIDSYHLTQLLARGGMGEVWLAVQHQPVNRQVALKLIKTGMQSSEMVARFEAERQALALMNHPHIARVLGGGTTEEGEPYFVMDYVEGSPLTKYCNQRQLGIDERLKLMLDVCSAVQHAHQKGIIHRDLKPENILVAEIDGRPTPIVIDFGLVKVYKDIQWRGDQGPQTMIGQILGTPQYMSPEQADPEFHDIDTRTDVYALGAILYELLTGLTPLDFRTKAGESVGNILRTIREQLPLKPSDRLGSLADGNESSATVPHTDSHRLHQILRGELDWIVMKAIEKDREDRFDSVSALAADIQRFLNGEPITARPTTWSYKARKFVRRNKLAVAMSGLLTAILLISTIVSALFAIQANWERNRAEQLALKEQKARLNEDAAIKKERVTLQKLQEVSSRRPQQLINASQRGRWGDVLTIADEQLADPTDDRAWWHIQKLQAHYFKMNHNAATEELANAIEADSDQLYCGSLKLWDAELKLLSQPIEARRLVSEALAFELPPDEEFYAKALTAESLEQSGKFASQAIDLNPYDLRYHKQAVAIWFLQGKHELLYQHCMATIPLFQEETSLRFFRALAIGLTGDRAAMQEYLEDDHLLKAEEKNAIKDIQRGFEDLGNLIMNFDLRQANPLFTLRLVNVVTPLTGKGMPMELNVRAPRDSFSKAQRLIVEALPITAAGSQSAKNEFAIKLAEFANQEQNGFFHALSSMLHFTVDNDQEAVNQMLMAAEAGWVIPYSKAEALFMAGIMSVFIAISDPSEENNLQVRDLLKQIQAAGIPEHRRMMFISMAVQFGEPLIALAALQQLPVEEHQTADWLKYASRASLALGMYEQAAELSHQWLAIDPDNTEAKERLTIIESKIRELSSR